MPVPSTIAQAAGGFQMNERLFEKSFEGLNAEEWCCCPTKSPNGLIWVAGHIVWARSRTLFFLGTEWTKPWLSQFERGSKPGEAEAYPAPEEIVAAWNEAKAALKTAMENATEEALNAPGPERMPSFDGKMSGLISFLRGTSRTTWGRWRISGGAWGTGRWRGRAVGVFVGKLTKSNRRSFDSVGRKGAPNYAQDDSIV